MKFLNALTLVFVIAKLTGHLNWGWFACFVPTMIHFAIAILLILLWIGIGIYKAATR